MHRYNQIVQPPNFDATPATAKADLGVGRRGKKNVHKFEAKAKFTLESEDSSLRFAFCVDGFLRQCVRRLPECCHT